MSVQRCYGCMHPHNGSGLCPHCGYDSTRPHAAHQLPAGTILKDQYLVGRVLGQGGFGITYLGWDLYLDIPVAIKEYYPGGTVSRDTAMTLAVSSYTGEIGERFHTNKERFLREAKTLARLSDIAEIVQVKNFFLANNTAYIVMEYVKGITLKQYISNQGGKLDADHAISLLRPVMEALGKVHSAGLVHRDISPDNIMMLPDGQVKLLDFGAVRDVGMDVAVNRELNRSTEAILKQGYAPIEQYQSRGSLGPWTDVYALCATIYYSITGKIPPDAPERLLGEEDLPLAKLAPDLTDRQRDALIKGMELRAENRYASVNALCDALFATDPTVIHKTSIAEKKSRQRKSRKGPLVAVLSVALVLILVTIGAVILLDGFFKSGASNPSDTLAKQTKSPGTATKNPDHEPEPEELLTGQCGPELTWTLDPDTGEMTVSGTGRMWDYTGEGDRPWENQLERIQSLVLTDDVLNVGAYGFSGCTQLTQVRFGDAFEHIGVGAFAGSGLEIVEIPDSVRGIGENAFNHCQSLQRVELPTDLQKLAPRTFLGCINLEILFVGPETVIGVDEDTGATPFNDHDATDRLEKLVFLCLKDSDTDGFAQKYGFDCIYYNDPGDQSSGFSGKIGDQVTWSLNTITGHLVVAGHGVTWDYTGRNLPWRDYSQYIRSVTVQEGITGIGHYTFANCDSLETVTLPDSLGRLEGGSFVGCSSLKSVSIGKNTTLSRENVDGFVVTPFNDQHETDFPENLEITCDSGSDAESFAQQFDIKLNLHEASTGGNTDSDTDEPDTDTDTGAKTVSGKCGDNLTWVLNLDTGAMTVDGTGKMWNFHSSNYQGDCDCVWADYYEQIRSVTIGNGVTSVGSYAFMNCNNLTKVTLGNSVKVIERCGFYQTPLKTVTIPNSVEKISDWAFYECASLKTVSLGAVKEIGYLAFCGTAIETLVIPDSVHTLGKGAFGSCNQLRSITIGASVTVIPPTAFDFSFALEEVYIPANVKEIGAYAFSSCTALKRVTLASAETQIAPTAFNSCTNFQGTVILGEDVEPTVPKFEGVG